MKLIENNWKAQKWLSGSLTNIYFIKNNVLSTFIGMNGINQTSIRLQSYKKKSFRSVGFQQQKKLPWKLLTIGLADVARHANHLWGKKAHILSDKQKSQYGEINQVTAFRKCHWEYSFFFMKWHGLFFPSAQLTHKHRFALLKYLG